MAIVEPPAAATAATAAAAATAATATAPSKACPVCRDPNARRFMVVSGREYWRCDACHSTFLDDRHHLTPAEEAERYRLHRNDPNDEGYRRFLSKLVDPLLSVLPAGSAGLDFGCGPPFEGTDAPAVASMLRERDHTVSLYDPHFFPDVSLLDPSHAQYDFITATEVMEHVSQPAEVLDTLDGLLRPGGVLAVMTSFQTDDAAFATWHYRRDPTHIVFYREETLRLLAEARGWTCEIPAKDVAFMRKPAA